MKRNLFTLGGKMKVQIIWSVLLACLLVPAATGVASVSISINDIGEGNPTVSVSGFDSATLATILNNEAFDLHGEYLSFLILGNGTVKVTNFNFLEPPSEGGGISDTLNIVFTGHTPTAGDLNNLAVDLHFRSDPESGTALPPLANGISITETGTSQDLSEQIFLATGIADFSLTVTSDVTAPVPEPSAMLLLASGLIGLAGYGRKRFFRK